MLLGGCPIRSIADLLAFAAELPAPAFVASMEADGVEPGN